VPRRLTCLCALPLALACSGAGDKAANDVPPPVQSFTALSLQAGPGAGQVPAGGTKDNQALELFSSTTASGPMELLYPASEIMVRAKGDSCEGAPQLILVVDGAVVLSTEVPESDWTDFPAGVSLARGRHTFEVIFPNDHWEPGRCDRNLIVDRITLFTDRRPGHDSLEGANLNSTWGASRVSDSLASTGQALEFTSATSATGVVVLSRHMGAIAARVRGDQCQGAPDIELDVDGKEVLTSHVPETAWAERWGEVSLGPGEHTVTVRFPNDMWIPPDCDRNLYVDKIWFAAAVPPGKGSGAPPPR